MQPEPLITIRSRTACLPEPNIDTDQIIPARYLTVTDRGGLGETCFRDWRFDKAGEPTGHALNSLDARSHAILVAGDNFGCGSSREHAPWALLDFGFRAIVTSTAADIFKSNAAKNGLLVAEIDAQSHQALLSSPGEVVEIDLEASVVKSNGVEAGFQLDPFVRTCLMQGVDPLGYILQQSEAIQSFEARAST
ncbi:MAG: 3-isopropylmalate dehydratase small subunit [Pseudomonadota bacterium]